MNAQLSWLDDPEVFQVNRLDAHSDHKIYGDEADFQEKREELYQSLNGRWKFQWAKNPAQWQKDFYEPDFDSSGFTEIVVPGHMELAGFDRIHYINTMYPWEGHVFRRPPRTEVSPEGIGLFSEAEYNPVGSYLTVFDLKKDLIGKRVCIRFDGVEQAMYLWLNGSFVGYAEDSFSPSEFDLTPYVREKENLLAVAVFKRSTAAYLEDQDFFRFSGIFRDVILYGKPSVHVEDLWAKPELSKDGTVGSFSLELKLSGENVSDCLVEYRLLDKEKHPVVTGKKSGSPKMIFEETEVKAPVLWSNENPYLYELQVRIFGKDGTLTVIASTSTGFRRISLDHDKIMRLNGRRLILNGVNRHEWNPRTGRVITMEDMLWDVECLKRNHINAVRTSHYPNHREWYRLCDEAGIYVMAETNLESHGSWQKQGAVEPSWNVPGSCPEWLPAVLDRAKSNFETFKNHPSILFWSLGNESYAGEDLVVMHRYFKQVDPGRLVHYEGVFQNRKYEDSISDMESQMYAPPKRIREYLQNDPKKPMIVCEYMHDMGNSMGGLSSYMELLDEFPMYQGGFIWDFIDQALYVEDPVTGQEVLRYGGDFDDRPSDYEFSGNGIVFADRKEKPAMQEVRYYYGRT